MWKLLRSIAIGFFLLSLSCLFPAISFGEETTGLPTQEEWNQFKMDWTDQQNDLNLLQTKLDVLSQNSTEQQQTVMKLQTQVDVLQNRLTRARQNLQTANESLAEARKELQETRNSLEELKKEIEALEHQIVIAKRQRDVWAGISIITVGATIFRR